jgi:hypothetical protein
MKLQHIALIIIICSMKVEHLMFVLCTTSFLAMLVLLIKRGMKKWMNKQNKTE